MNQRLNPIFHVVIPFRIFQSLFNLYYLQRCFIGKRRAQITRTPFAYYGTDGMVSGQKLRKNVPANVTCSSCELSRNFQCVLRYRKEQWPTRINMVEMLVVENKVSTESEPHTI